MTRRRDLIGGPVWFEIAAAAPGRIWSLLLLNTIVAVDTFRRPYRRPGRTRQPGLVMFSRTTGDRGRRTGQRWVWWAPVLRLREA